MTEFSMFFILVCSEEESTQLIDAGIGLQPTTSGGTTGELP
jgi:hypothetical protein